MDGKHSKLPQSLHVVTHSRLPWCTLPKEWEKASDTTAFSITRPDNLLDKVTMMLRMNYVFRLCKGIPSPIETPGLTTLQE